jgi:Domain of unknown function (DUF6259)
MQLPILINYINKKEYRMFLKKSLILVCMLAVTSLANAGKISDFDGKTRADEIAQGWKKNKYLGQGQSDLVSDDKGGQALKLSNNRSVTKKVMHVFGRRNFPVTPNEKIKISFRLKGKGSYTFGIYCFGKKSGPYVGCQLKELYAKYQSIDAKDWKARSIEFTIPKEQIRGSKANIVKVFVSLANGTIIIDDVDFTRIKPTIKPAFILKNKHTKIALGSAKNGFSCLKITDTKSKAHFVFPELSAKKHGLWELSFVKPGQANKITLNNLSPAKKVISKKKLAGGSEELTLIWNASFEDEKNAVDVIVKILLKPDGESQWRIDVQNKSSKYALWSVDFPIFLTVAAPGTADVVFPGGVLGGTLRKKNHKPGRFIYPTESWPMHFMSFVTKNRGLYIGVHDSQQRPSKAFLSNGQDISFRQFPDNMAKIGTGYKSDFPIIVKLHDGNWWKAAKIYRAWVTTLPRWYNKPLKERNLPKAFLEAGIWMCMWQSPRAVARIVTDMENYFKVDAGAFWCEWGQHRFDHNLPEFFPFRSHMEESVKKMKDNGTAVMPYINARAWGKDNKEFTSDQVQKGLVRDYSGKLTIENYGNGLGIMCPAYPMWQEKIQGINRKLINEAKVNAVYWDQVGAAKPLACFAKNHKHPAGCNYWVATYNSMLAKTRKDIIGKKQIALTTESGPDAYDFDGMLNCWWNNTHNSQNAIPLTAAVLCDRVRYFPLSPGKIQTFQAYIMIHGRFFLWGMPSPIHHRESENNKYPCSDAKRSKAHATMRKMVQCRIAAKKFMVYGELMGELKAAKPLTSVSAVFDCKKVKSKVTFPAVRASIWKSSDGELGFAFVNFSGSKQTFSFQTNTSQYSPLKPNKWQIIELRPDSKKALGKTTQKYVSSITLEPYGVKFLALGPAK